MAFHRELLTMKEASTARFRLPIVFAISRDSFMDFLTVFLKQSYRIKVDLWDLYPPYSKLVDLMMPRWKIKTKRVSYCSQRCQKQVWRLGGHKRIMRDVIADVIDHFSVLYVDDPVMAVNTAKPLLASLLKDFEAVTYGGRRSSKLNPLIDQPLLIQSIVCQWRDCNQSNDYRHNPDVVKFKKCAACKVVRYCSRQCQKMDWNSGGHKRICSLFG